jgi:hypothetical protein
MTTKYDIKNRLKEYFPIIFELIGENNLDWRTIEKRFGEKLDEHIRKVELTGQLIRVEASLYHIITASKEGKDEATRLLDFITKLFQELITRLDKEERKLIKKNIFDLLTNIDMKYLNFLGELCVLNQVTRNTKLKLIATEQPLDKNKKDGTKIDFVFFNADTDRKLLVEIVNLHINDNVTGTDNKIETLLDQKIKGKLNRKGLRTTFEFLLIPVVWGPIDDIKRLIQYYETYQPQFKNTSIPVCYMTFSDNVGNRVHKFGTIDTILK